MAKTRTKVVIVNIKNFFIALLSFLFAITGLGDNSPLTIPSFDDELMIKFSPFQLDEWVL